MHAVHMDIVDVHTCGPHACSTYGPIWRYMDVHTCGPHACSTYGPIWRYIIIIEWMSTHVDPCIQSGICINGVISWSHHI